MKTIYTIFACAVFFLFCLFEMRGTTFDTNQTTPKPNMYSARGGGGGGGGGFGFGYFSSK